MTRKTIIRCSVAVGMGTVGIVLARLGEWQHDAAVARLPPGFMEHNWMSFQILPVATKILVLLYTPVVLFTVMAFFDLEHIPEWITYGVFFAWAVLWWYFVAVWTQPILHSKLLTLGAGLWVGAILIAALTGPSQGEALFELYSSAGAVLWIGLAGLALLARWTAKARTADSSPAKAGSE